MKPIFSGKERRVGPDLIRMEGDVLAIYSRRNMPDWVVREFSRPAIWFQDQKCFLLAREPVRGHFRWKYSLSPWPSDHGHSPSTTITYSTEYVVARERDYHRQLASTSTGNLLRPFSPVLGFLWSGTKDRLALLGLSDRSLTSSSIALEFGVFTVLGIYVGYLGGWSVRSVILLAVLGLDLLMRYDAELRDRERQFGFLEWCFRR